jgi:anti-anti-sigma factor
LTFDVNHSLKFLRLMESHNMSTAITTPRPVDRRDSNTASFATRWLQPSVAVITAHGDLDASNAQELVDYALRDAERTRRLALDLTGVDFFGTAGFSALHTLNVRCAAAGVEWVMVPSTAVSRLLRICDPDSTLPIATTMSSALSLLQADQRRLLQLVTEPS